MHRVDRLPYCTLTNVFQVACLGEVKAVFWAKGVENIYFEDPETHYQVLESMEGYWIGGSGKPGTGQELILILQGMELDGRDKWSNWLFIFYCYFVWQVWFESRM